jgi:hypothetical protein
MPGMVSADSSEHSREATIVVDPADIDDVRKLAMDNNAEVEVVDQEGFTGFEVLLVIIGANAAVDKVLDEIDRRKGGQVFDLRPGAPRLAYRTTDVMYGFVAIIGADGSVNVEVKEPKARFSNDIELVRKLISNDVTTPIRELGAKLREQLGDAATVVVGPQTAET